MDHLAPPPDASRSLDDRLGQRALTPDTGGSSLEVLRLDPTLSACAGFESALRHGTAALASFQHAGSFGLPRLDRDDRDGRLMVVWRHVPGRQLSEVLADSAARGARLTTSTVLYVLREVAACVRAQHAHRARTVHGLLTPERVRLTSEARVLVADHVFGAALAALPLASATELWQRWGIAVPPNPGSTRFGPMTDGLQIGLLGLAMLLGRPVGADEYPSRVGALLAQVEETNLVGQPVPLGLPLRRWLERALWLAPNGPFSSVGALDHALGDLLSDETGYVAVPIGLDGSAPGVAGAPEGNGELDDESTEVSAATEEEAAASERPSGELARALPHANAAENDWIAGAAPIDSVGAFELDLIEWMPDELDQLSRHTPAAPLEMADAAAGVSEAGGENGNGASWTPPQAEAGSDDIACGSWGPPSGGPRASPALDLPGAALPDEGEQEEGNPDEPGADLAADVIPFATVTPVSEEIADSEISPDPISREASAIETPPPEAAPPEPSVVVAPPAPVPHSPAAHAEGRPVAVSSFGGPLFGATEAVETRADGEAARAVLASLARWRDAAADAPGAEWSHDAGEQQAPASSRGRVLLGAAAILLVAGGFFAARPWLPWGGVPAGPGVLVLDSRPPAATVRVDGQQRGVTPLQIELAAGAYEIEMQGGDRRERFRLALEAGQRITRVVAFETAGQGGTWLEITTTPAGARVSVNGVERGRSPVRVEGLSPGEHLVLAESDVARVERRVTVRSEGEVLDLPLSGFLHVSSPLHVQVYEGGKRLGSSRDRRIAAPAGRRQIEVVAEKVGYRDTYPVDIPEGGSVTVSVAPPHGTVHLTADKPAVVTVDGSPVGPTPLANLSLPLGEHEIVFASPAHGELRYTVVVSLNGANRLHAAFSSGGASQPRRPVRRPR
jgi:hypothetical protein